MCSEQSQYILASPVFHGPDTGYKYVGLTIKESVHFTAKWSQISNIFTLGLTLFIDVGTDWRHTIVDGYSDYNQR